MHETFWLLFGSAAGCKTCKEPGYKPTAACLEKRAAGGGRPTRRPPKSSSSIKTPKAAKKEARSATATKPLLVRTAPPAGERTSARRRAAAAAGRSTSGGGAATGLVADYSSSSESDAVSGEDGATVDAGATAAAPPRGELRYSYASGKSPLLAAQGLEKMRADVKALGAQPAAPAGITQELVNVFSV